MLKNLSKLLGFAGYVVQYGCWTHVTFEYAGDFVFVSVPFKPISLYLCIPRPQCSGPSMEPTLYSNNVLITEKISHRRGGISRGDIVVAKNPNNPRQFICKRVIALPGDQVVTQSSFHPFVGASHSTSLQPIGVSENASGKPTRPVDYEHVEHLEDAHLETGALTQRVFRSNIIVVPRGHVWIEGDNAANSMDSRQYGPIPLGLIRSRAVFRLWPLSEMRLL